MNVGATIAIMIVGCSMIGAIILLVFGCQNGDAGLIRDGIGIITLALGAVIAKYFPTISNEVTIFLSKFRRTKK